MTRVTVNSARTVQRAQRRMQRLEVFLHPSRSSGEAARTLAQDLRSIFPALEIMIQELPEARNRAETVGIFTVPAFVLDGAVFAIGVPTEDWLVQKLRENSRRGESE